MTKHKEGIQRIMGLSPKSRGYVSSGLSDKDLKDISEEAKWQFRHRAFECDFDGGLLHK